MTNPISPTPAQVQARPLFRPAPRRTAESAAEAIQAPRVWQVLWQVMHQQLAHDALLLWHYDRRHEQLSLLHAAPRFLQTPGVTVSGGEQLAPLAEGHLEALAHVHCAASHIALEQALWGWGLHSAITCLLSAHEREAYLITCGFRQRWQVIAHHSGSVTAFLEYLRACQRAALPAPPQWRWWETPSHAPRLWQQAYRPSVMRTIHDCNETLSDAAEAWRVGGVTDPDLSRSVTAPTCHPEAARQLAHEGASLMARLESVYLDPRPTVDIEELLSEALLLVRGAYDLCGGDWPGCLAAVRQRPTLPESTPGAIRHALVDWIVQQMETEQRADT